HLVAFVGSLIVEYEVAVVQEKQTEQHGEHEEGADQEDAAGLLHEQRTQCCTDLQEDGQRDGQHVSGAGVEVAAVHEVEVLRVQGHRSGAHHRPVDDHGQQREQEGHEEAQVAGTHAVVDPDTVVVEAVHTPVTDTWVVMGDSVSATNRIVTLRASLVYGPVRRVHRSQRGHVLRSHTARVHRAAQVERRGVDKHEQHGHQQVVLPGLEDVQQRQDVAHQDGVSSHDEATKHQLHHVVP
ncbi:hypothetical protein EGW08_018516, partial [Elysia chlorotica]